MSGTFGVRISPEARRGEGGENQVKAFFSDTFQWCIMSKDIDFGTDLWVMPVSAEGVPSFVFLGVQVKKGASYFRYPQKDEQGNLVGWWFRLDANHEASWTNGRIAHIVVLISDEGTMYWSKIESSQIDHSCQMPRILVRKDHVLKKTDEEELSEFACSTYEKSAFNGVVWNGLKNIKNQDRIRLAMLAPRVIAPHVNKHIDNLKGHEALASLLYGNEYGLEWYWRAGSGSMADVAMQKGKRKNEAWASSDWCWKAAAAFYDYLDGQGGRLDELFSVAKSPEERAASAVMQFAFDIDNNDWSAALQHIEAVMTYDLCPVDKAWLLVHESWAMFELGRRDEAISAGSNAVSLCLQNPDDITANGICGAAMRLLWQYDWIWGNVKSSGKQVDVAAVIQSSDNPIFWWLELGERSIAGNAVSNRWLHSIGEAEKTHSLRRRFISLILQTAFLGDRDAWKRYCCLQAENAYAQIEDDNGERANIVNVLEMFRRCSSKDDYRKVLRSAIQRASNSRIVEYAETVSLNESTHSTALNDLTLFQCIGDYLSADKADEVCRWCLTTMASRQEYSQKVSATFDIPSELFETLKACYRAANRDVQEKIEQWFLELPCVGESSASEAQNLTILFPDSFWSDGNLTTLLQRGDDGSLQQWYEYKQSSHDEESEAQWHVKVKSGQVDVIKSIDDAKKLSEDEIQKVSDCFSAYCVETIERYERCGVVFSSGRDDVLGAFLFCGYVHPELVDWTAFVKIMLSNAEALQDKRWPLKFLIHFSNELPAGIREELFSMLSCFVKSFEDKANIVYWLAYEAMASLCEDERQNIIDYLISNKRYNAVARIVQRFPAERYVQLMVTMLKIGFAGTCDAVAGALAKLELCNLGGMTVAKIVDDIMINGTLAQKEWVTEVVVESTEEIPVEMREQLIAMEDSIGASKRKALKERLDA